ncbi:MerR family transcriptional regulator [Clostridium sp. D2Q-11]|uniref:MerR family transcriptional regulator n=1 Tax=Anaeromonas frigoriresistens TaxID=2683708 RepID=A0A942UUK2_9FIRM|nr:helix-turn-helix domain-containing protein [Anaeromonas frigoriresistens]MBS4539388.1 MerR family transcriptional regulator [Anaeromonas frigoriresistens]
MDRVQYSIKEVSERLDISYRTLHYYEKKFNLQINRDKSGNRIYTDENIDVLEKILDFKSKGMSLDGIKTLFIEKGILEDEKSDLVVLDEVSLDIKENLINEIRLAVSKELKGTNEALEKVLEDNKSLRDELRSIKRQNEDHYSKIDKRLTEWRNNSEKPWWKKLFK